MVPVARQGQVLVREERARRVFSPLGALAALGALVLVSVPGELEWGAMPRSAGEARPGCAVRWARSADATTWVAEEWPQGAPIRPQFWRRPEAGRRAPSARWEQAVALGQRRESLAWRRVGAAPASLQARELPRA